MTLQQDRATTIRQTIADIGGCPLEVPIVVRKRIKLSRAGRNIAATYEGKTIFNITNPILGNPPNAATHFRMLATIAKSPSIGPDTWVLIFEDDALLHPQIASAYPSIIERQKIIRHTFEMGTHLKADRIQYGVCKSVKGSRKETVCPAVPLSSLKGGPPLLYPDISFSTCFRGYRCAQAYAVTKRKAAQYISVYEQLNSGNTSCPRDIWSQSSPTINTALGPNAACADDPFVVNKYLAQCTGPKVGCAGLVVGDTLGMNSSTPIKATGGASQTGLFLQRANTKTRAKGHFVVRMMLMTAWVREHFGCGGKKHGCGPPAADWDPKTMLPSDRYDIEAPDLYSDE